MEGFSSHQTNQTHHQHQNLSWFILELFPAFKCYLNELKIFHSQLAAHSLLFTTRNHQIMAANFQEFPANVTCFA